MNNAISPNHYRDDSGIQCIDIASFMMFCSGNCFKYIYRAGKKGNKLEDLQKARQYAEWASERCESVPFFLKPFIKMIASHRDELTASAMNAIASVNVTIFDRLGRIIGFRVRKWDAVLSSIDTLIKECECEHEQESNAKAA